MSEDFPQKIIEKTQIKFLINKYGLYAISINAPSWVEDQKPTLTISYTNQYEQVARIFFLKL